MNTQISWKIRKLIFLVVLGLIFISHLPFIEADPDRNMAVGRGPFTDEGLNTIQIRNWINQGNLDLWECDNLLKTPMLGFPLAATYKLFGTSHEVSRLHVLVLVFLALIWIGSDQKNNLVAGIFLLVTMLQYQIFHSSHFSMGEMLSVAAILLSIHFLSRAIDPINNQKFRTKQAILSASFLSLSWFIKIQFIYLIFLAPLVLLIYWLSGNHFSRKIVPRTGLYLTGTLLFFTLIYLFAWYLPNREAYDFMMAHQSGEFGFSSRTLEFIRFNLDYHFITGWVQVFFYFFGIMLITGIIILRKTFSVRYRILFFSAIIWFLLESHKLTMVYLPTRYQVSFFASMGLLISVVAAEILSEKLFRLKSFPVLLTISGIVILTVINIFNYVDTLKNRQYSIRETNTYVAQSAGKDDVIIGAWAPSLTWESKSRAVPVWNNFLNYTDPLQNLNPKAIIAETDEQDSEQAYKNQGIDLLGISDSARTVKIGHWNLGIYWVSPLI